MISRYSNSRRGSMSTPEAAPSVSSSLSVRRGSMRISKGRPRLLQWFAKRWHRMFSSTRNRKNGAGAAAQHVPSVSADKDSAMLSDRPASLWGRLFSRRRTATLRSKAIPSPIDGRPLLRVSSRSGPGRHHFFLHRRHNGKLAVLAADNNADKVDMERRQSSLFSKGTATDQQSDDAQQPASGQAPLSPTSKSRSHSLKVLFQRNALVYSQLREQHVLRAKNSLELAKSASHSLLASCGSLSKMAATVEEASYCGDYAVDAADSNAFGNDFTMPSAKALTDQVEQSYTLAMQAASGSLEYELRDDAPQGRRSRSEGTIGSRAEEYAESDIRSNQEEVEEESMQQHVAAPLRKNMSEMEKTLNEVVIAALNAVREAAQAHAIAADPALTKSATSMEILNDDAVTTTNDHMQYASDNGAYTSKYAGDLQVQPEQQQQFDACVPTDEQPEVFAPAIEQLEVCMPTIEMPILPIPEQCTLLLSAPKDAVAAVNIDGYSQSDREIYQQEIAAECSFELPQEETAERFEEAIDFHAEIWSNSKIGTHDLGNADMEAQQQQQPTILECVKAVGECHEGFIEEKTEMLASNDEAHLESTISIVAKPVEQEVMASTPAIEMKAATDEQPQPAAPAKRTSVSELFKSANLAVDSDNDEARDSDAYAVTLAESPIVMARPSYMADPVVEEAGGAAGRYESDDASVPKGASSGAVDVSHNVKPSSIMAKGMSMREQQPRCEQGAEESSKGRSVFVEREKTHSCHDLVAKFSLAASRDSLAAAPSRTMAASGDNLSRSSRTRGTLVSALISKFEKIRTSDDDV